MNTKVYVVTQGKGLYYVSKDYEEAEYEKKSVEDDTWQGRHSNMKITEVDIDMQDLDKMIKLNNGVSYKAEDIINLI